MSDNLSSGRESPACRQLVGLLTAHKREDAWDPGATDEAGDNGKPLNRKEGAMRLRPWRNTERVGELWDSWIPPTSVNNTLRL